MNRNSEVQHFLIVFDHDAGELLELIEFGSDGERAVAEYSAKERAFQPSHQSHPRLEIVLIGSDSLDTVKRTHANYFSGPPADSKYFDFAGVS